MRSIKDITEDDINDPNSLRELVVILLNKVEEQKQIIESQKKEIQELKDEINRLKGEQAKPKFTKGKPAKDISSEKHRNKKKPHKKKAVKPKLEVDKQILCNTKPEGLPEDAVFKSYRTVIEQDIVFERKNTEFKIAVWYSPSEKKNYESEVPGYHGYFGSNLKSFVLAMHHSGDLSHSKLLNLLESIGVKVSAGSINNILQENTEDWPAEKQDILRAGLHASFLQSDTTGAKVAGNLWQTHVLCSNDFMVFSTLAGKSRRDFLSALQGVNKEKLMLVYNTKTQYYLDYFKISAQDKALLKTYFNDKPAMSLVDFREKIIELMPGLSTKKSSFNWVCDAFALGFYETQTEFSPVKILVSDNAPEYNLVGQAHALCWIHDARHYNKLSPGNKFHLQILTDFKVKYWQFYRKLMSYKESPKPDDIKKIEKQFDKLFVPDTSYFQLNQLIEKTIKNKNELLTVLKHPEVPLHNNQAELAARYQVRKRDICLHTLTEKGTQLQDAMMSIVHTCRLLRINAFKYIRDRIEGVNQFFIADILQNKYQTQQ